MSMIIHIIISVIIFQSLTYCSDLPFCARQEVWHTPKPIPLYTPLSLEPRPRHYYTQCQDGCRGPPPQIGSIPYSRLSLKNVLENVELICEPTTKNRIHKILVENNHLQYNATCNGVLAGREVNPGVIYYAVVKTKGEEETVMPIKASTYTYSANYNMGSESLTEKAQLMNSICDGGILSSYSVWIADDPTQGCCRDGVRRTRAVYYKLEIRGGNCCTVCNLLSATDIYDSPLLM